MRRFLILIGGGALVCAGMAMAQDSPSLGDLARQTRAQKQQKDSKDATNSAPGADSKTGTAAKASHVISNEDLPASTAASGKPGGMSHDSVVSDAGTQPVGNHEAQGERWKSQIQQQKAAIAQLQKQITEEGDSVHYAGGNCVSNCAQWNQRQQQKQQEVESMKAQLEEQQKRLEDMQDAARKQGFGSSVYDP